MRPEGRGVDSPDPQGMISDPIGAGLGAGCAKYVIATVHQQQSPELAKTTCRLGEANLAGYELRNGDRLDLSSLCKGTTVDPDLCAVS